MKTEIIKQDMSKWERGNAYITTNFGEYAILRCQDCPAGPYNDDCLVYYRKDEFCIGNVHGIDNVIKRICEFEKDKL